jgi:hypothetical protein
VGLPRYSMVALVVALLGFPAAARADLTWSAPIAIDHEGPQSVACPSASECVAVDYQGNEAAFNPASPGAAVVSTIDSTGYLGLAVFGTTYVSGVACASPTECTAVTHAGAEVTFNPGAPGTPTPVKIDNGNVDGVACISAGACVAVDEGGQELVFDPATGAVSETADIDGTRELNGLTCPSATDCVAFDNIGQAVAFTPATGAVIHTTAILSNTEVSDNISVNGITCAASATECTVVDSTGEAVGFAPATGAVLNTTTIDAGGDLTSVGCTSASECAAVDGSGREVSFDPASPGTASRATIDAGGRLTSLACPAPAGACTAVDADGRAATFNPSSPGTPAPTTIDHDSTGVLNGVACSSASECVAVDVGGQELTFDPAAPVAPTPATFATGEGLHGVACIPSVGQCTAVGGGDAVTFNPASPDAALPTAIAISPNGNASIACPSATLCAAFAGGDGFGVAFNPAAPGAGTSIPIEPPHGPPYTPSPSSVACVSTSACVALDLDGAEYAFNPSAPAGVITHAVVDPSTQFAAAIACPATNECVAVDVEGNEVTFNPASPGTPHVTSIEGAGNAGTIELQSVSCPTASECVAVDSGGRAVTFDPAAPSSHTSVTIDGTTPIEGVACASASECVAVDQAGHVIVGSSAPVNASPPVISGKTTVGDKLSASQGTWSGAPISYAYQWQRCTPACVDIAGATSSSYTLVRSDAGARIRVVVTAGNADGHTAADAAQVGPVAGLPAVSGGSLDGLAARKPKLRFTLTAGKDAAPIKTIAVSLPSGLAFKGSHRTLAGAITVRSGGAKKVKFTVKAHGRTLTITLKATAAKAKITITSAAISVTRKLAKRVKHHKTKRLTVGIRTTNAGHATTKLALKLKV